MKIKTQFDTSICVIHSDNAREYYLRELSQFFSDHGIIHQPSCTRTPQQNGVVECKLRHLLDVTRVLSFHMQVPKPFWSDTVFTTCYLVNRIPSTILGGPVPHRVLYPSRHLFSLPPRIFGCMCYVHALDRGRNKLDPCTIKCVVLGYSHTQKGIGVIPLLFVVSLCVDVTFN